MERRIASFSPESSSAASPAGGVLAVYNRGREVGISDSFCGYGGGERLGRDFGVSASKEDVMKNECARCVVNKLVGADRECFRCTFMIC